MNALFFFTIKDGPNLSSLLEDLRGQKDFHDYLLQFQGKEVKMELSLRESKSEKLDMYAYYHKVILSIAVECLQETYEVVDKVKADYILKANCAKGILFNKVTGDEEIYLEDKSAMSRGRLYKYLSDCIFFLEDTYGVRVPDASRYRNEKFSEFRDIPRRQNSSREL
jgi:hypothetical protein